MEHRVVFSESDFAHLLLGGTIRIPAGRDDVAVCLTDMGFHRMIELAQEAAAVPPGGHRVGRVQRPGVQDIGQT